MKAYKAAFVWRFQTPNRGDLASSPYQYLLFREDAIAKVDISRDLNCPKVLKIFDNSEVIIVGGGGLLGLEKYIDKIRFFVKNYPKKTVIWGLVLTGPDCIHQLIFPPLKIVCSLELEIFLSLLLMTNTQNKG